MNEKKMKLLHRAYGIALSVVLCTLGIYFIASCIDIYLSGSNPFTRERVGDHLKELMPVIIVAVLGIIGGAVLSCFSKEDSKLKGKIDYKATIAKLSAKIDWVTCSDDFVLAVRKERIFRKRIKIACATVCALCLAVSLIYFLNTSNFPGTDITSEVAYSMVFLIPCAVIAMGSLLTYYIFSESSLKKEADEVKKALTVSKFEGKMPKAVLKSSSKKIMISRIVIISIAVLFIIIGACTGGAGSVLYKAINICTECVGMG